MKGEFKNGSVKFKLRKYEIPEFLRDVLQFDDFEGQKVFLGATNVIEDKVTRLIDVLSGRIDGGDSLELVGISALLSRGVKRLKIVIE